MEKEKRIRGLADTLLILLITIVTGTILIMACGADPAEAYSLFFRGIFGTPAAFAEIFVKACPLILTGLGCAVAYRTGFFNIGAEGQVLIGGVTSAAMMIYLGNSLPPVVLFLLMFLGSAAAAMIWGVIPAFFKAYWNTNETLFTLMMNYVAMQIVTFCIVFWENPEGSNTVGIINAPTQAGWLPALGEWTYGWNVIIIMAITLLMYFYLKYLSLIHI